MGGAEQLGTFASGVSLTKERYPGMKIGRFNFSVKRAYHTENVLSLTLNELYELYTLLGEVLKQEGISEKGDC